MQDRRIEKIFVLGAAPFIFCAVAFAVATAAMALGKSLSVASTAVSFFLFAVLFLCLERSSGATFRRLDYVLLSALLCCVTVLFGWITAGVFDTSYDGQTYQQEAVRQFVDGWNYFLPVSTSPERREMEFYYPLLNHYCTLPWMLWALITQITGNIEAAKLLQFVFLFGAFFSSLAALLMFRLPMMMAVLVAAGATANPVSLCQLFTFYVDGLFASSFLAAVSLGAVWYLNPSKLTAGAFASALIVTLHCKFTSTVTAITVVLGVTALLFARRDPRARSFASLSGATLAFGLLVLGFHPFLTNIAETGAVFYPIPTSVGIGQASENLAFQEVQLPYDFRGKNRFEKLARSIMSRPANPHDEIRSIFRWPWQFDGTEFDIFGLPDVRVGGFGALYPAALILALLAAAFGWRTTKSGLTAAGLTAILLGSVFLNPECWWARYTPQLWLLPFFVAIAIETAHTARGTKLLGRIAIVLLIVNSAAIILTNVSQSVEGSRQLRQELTSIGDSGRPVRVSFGRFRANELRLRLLGVPFSEENAPSCGAPKYLYGSHTAICSL